MRVGIDATNAGSGGGINHMREIILNLDIASQNFPQISHIVVYGPLKFLNQLPTHKLLHKKSHPDLNKNIFRKIHYQLFAFDKELQENCDILLSLTGDYIGGFRPIVGMSRNMLLYDRTIWKHIGNIREVLRFYLIYHKQKKSFQNSNGIIFISKYAKNIVTKSFDISSQHKTVIHHGISSTFISKLITQKDISTYTFDKPFRFIYVSTIHVYKHQWNVIDAINILRKKGYPVELQLIGGIIFKPAGKRLLQKIQQVDSKQEFINYLGHVKHKKIIELQSACDGIIFASSCENMPNTLIEAMASGLPVLCSRKQPMPEFLRNGGFYFNPYDVNSLVLKAEKYLQNPKLREKHINNSLIEIKKYSWQKTTQETFKFLIDIYSKN